MKWQTGRIGEINSETYTIAVSVKIQFQLTLLFSLFPFFLFLYLHELRASHHHSASLPSPFGCAAHYSRVFVRRRQVCTQT